MAGKKALIGPELEELQEHLAFGGDVELLIDAPSVVLDRADGDVEPLGNGRGGMAAQDELGQLLLARGELWP